MFSTSLGHVHNTCACERAHAASVESVTFLVIVALPVCFFQSARLAEWTERVNPSEKKLILCCFHLLSPLELQNERKFED